MVKKFFFILLCWSVTIHALKPAGPFAPPDDTTLTGPFKPEVTIHDPNRYLTEFVYPFEEEEEQRRVIEINLEDTSLAEIALFIENTFNIKFIYEDTVTKLNGAPVAAPASVTSAALEPIKVNYRTHKPMTRKELWELFLTFLDIVGKTISPGPEPGTYRINDNKTVVVDGGVRVPLPTYIGTNIAELPDNDMKIRYLYFVQNSSLATIFQIINAIRSANGAKIEQFSDVNGILITEKASNIKAMMAIIREIDKAAMPEAMSILKLRRADAEAVAKFYTELIGAQPRDQGPAAPYGRPRKQPTGSYFPPNMKVIPEPRTNTLILLGTPDAIKKVEDFIKENIDTELEKPYSPIHTYYLKYADATTVATYLNDLVTKQAGIDPAAAQYGGVRDGDKLLGPMRFVAEVKTNMILILGDYDDYLKINDLLQQIDIEQPQVILRVLLITVDLNQNKVLGTQLRNKNNDPLMDPCNSSLRDAIGKGTNFQNSGISNIIQNDAGTGATRLLGDLIQLARGQVAGTTAITLGQDVFGVWGFFRVLDAYTKANVIESPFLIATHKTKAQIISGETRRVAEAVVTGGSNVSQTSMTDLDANLEVTIMPLISSDGLITLDIEVRDDEFTGTGTEITRGNRVSRVVNTETILHNKEVLAIGGIIRSGTEDAYTKIPILGDIPIIGWLFKQKTQTRFKNSLLILISPEIIETYNDEPLNDFTVQRLADVEETFCQIDHLYQQRDPGHRWFFGDHSINEHAMIDAFLPGQPSAFSKESLRQRKQARQTQGQQRIVPAPAPEESHDTQQNNNENDANLINRPASNSNPVAEEDHVATPTLPPTTKNTTMLKKRSKQKFTQLIDGDRRV